MTEFVKVAGVETPVEVAQILNKIIDEKGNVDLDNLSEVGEKRFSDLSSSITNVKNSVSSLTTTVNGKIGATVSKAANGYIKFTNGVILQWGSKNWTGTYTTGNFPTSFKSFAVISAWDAGTAIAKFSSGITNVSTYYIRSSNGTWGCNWYAIGY